MSASSKKGTPIENASEVIERFGGIRPMAKKIDVAVTTIQGWKKRDVIPAGRRSVILEAAEEHNIDLSDVMSGAPEVHVDAANENAQSDEPIVLDQKEDASEISAEAPKEAKSTSVPRASVLKDEPNISDELEERLAAVEKTSVENNTKTMIALVALVILAVVAVLLFGRGGGQSEEERLQALEARTNELSGNLEDVAEDVEQVAEEQNSFFGAIVPENMNEKLARLQEQAMEAKEQAGAAVERAKIVSNDVLGSEAGTLEERMVKLDGHVQDITGSPILANVLDRVQTLTGNAGGQEQLNQIMAQLSGFVANAEPETTLSPQGDVVENQNAVTFEDQLDQARQENPALGEAFAGVPSQDLKAAAMLLAMSQFRSSLNRDNAAFDQDFEVLMGLVGEDNVALRSSLEKLAPHAQDGVLTPAGLSNEFKTMAGDAVIASLSGEDISLEERAKARMNDVFQVEKDGELITGTETQAVMAKADNHLEQGDVAAAIATVQTLDGPAAAKMSGWISKAQATLDAQAVKDTLTKTINLKAYGLEGLTAAGGQVLPGSNGGLTQNEDTGINIYRGNSLEKMIKDAMPKQNSVQP